MLIKALQGLCDNNDIINCNNVRISKIKENITNEEEISKLFNVLENELSCKNRECVKKIIIENMFYEEISDITISKIIKAYQSNKNKDVFINKLRESYVIRGEKGFYFAWMPIIIKGE